MVTEDEKERQRALVLQVAEQELERLAFVDLVDFEVVRDYLATDLDLPVVEELEEGEELLANRLEFGLSELCNDVLRHEAVGDRPHAAQECHVLFLDHRVVLVAHADLQILDDVDQQLEVWHRENDVVAREDQAQVGQRAKAEPLIFLV